MELGHYQAKTGDLVPFRIDAESLLILGRKKAGKTALAIKLALEKIHAGEPLVFLDNRGEAIEHLLDHIPKHRQKDVILFRPASDPFAFNILADRDPSSHALLATTIKDTVRTVWKFDKVSTSNIDQYMRAGVQTLLSFNRLTLLHLGNLLSDSAYRDSLVSKLLDPFLIRFWKDFDVLTDKEQREQTGSTLSKLRALGLEPLVRRCIGQVRNRLTFKDKIVLVSLNESALGAENTSLLGALVLTSLYLDCVAGETTTLFIDGTHRFATGLITSLLDCPNLTTVLSLQYLAQLNPDLQAGVLAGVNRIVAYRTSLKDAKALESEFPRGDGDIQLHEQHAFDAMVSGAVVTEIHTSLHSYPRTFERQRIEDRCRSQCSASVTAITKRLAKIAEATPRKRRTKP